MSLKTDDRIQVMQGAGKHSGKKGVVLSVTNTPYKWVDIKLDNGEKLSMDKNRLKKINEDTIMDNLSLQELVDKTLEEETINFSLHKKAKKALQETLEDSWAINNYGQKIQDFVTEILTEDSAKRKSLLRKMGVSSESELSPEEKAEFKKALEESFLDFYDFYHLETNLDEELSQEQKDKREEIVLKLKKKKDEFQKRYGDKWKDVIYATATKQVTSNNKTNESKLNEKLDFTAFNKTVDQLKKSGVRVKDVKFKPTEATYTITNYELGKVMKYTYLDNGKLKIRQVGEVDIVEPKTAKKGRGRPKGSTSGAQHDTGGTGKKEYISTHTLSLPSRGYKE